MESQTGFTFTACKMIFTIDLNLQTIYRLLLWHQSLNICSFMIPGEGVRLSGGSDLCSGRVEVLRGSAWNTVCDAGFDRQDAEVVCRQLQCGIPQEVLGAARFGKGQGPVWSDEIQCRGNESGLHVCPTSSTERPSCTHANDVGLVCVGYRLVNGSDSCSGRVELHHEGVWGTVCDRYWDLQDATVLCQQLKCGYAVAVLGQAHFGQGSGKIWADKFNCEGSEADLFKCPASEYGRGDCTHENDAGVICTAQAGRVRLAAGPSRCEGRVEFYYNRAWGRVLHDSWGITEASVVCRELDCGSAMEVSNSSRYGTGHSDVCLTGIRCTGDESHLINCSLPQQVSCSTSNGAAVLCSNHTALRLVGGGGACTGRVEVYHNGSWGMVCDDSWDLADAEVVCKQLQCGTALNPSVSASFGQGTGPIWLDDLRCQGNESTLWGCASGGWGATQLQTQGGRGSQFKKLRLSRGCSGLAEVFYNGTWGSVCYNDMDENTVKIICHEGNCGESSEITMPRPTSSTVHKWLDNVKCREHDSTLWQCPSSPCGKNDCWDNEVAEIDCKEPAELRLAGSSSPCSGRVEVRFEGSWGTVCDDSWDMKDAQVVCRQFGCGAAESTRRGETTFGQGNGIIWLDEVNCRGSEMHLWDCRHSPLGHNDCYHKEDAWVTCAGKNINAFEPSQAPRDVDVTDASVRDAILEEEG
ncbi:UNVERIFIED_CONTAM: hypothetical protein FKN15_027208 [Acipenser sinensis]